MITIMVHLMRMNCYGKAKTSEMVTVIFWRQKYSPPCKKVIGFVACRVKSKILGIGAAERSWGDVKTIKSGKRSDIISDVSEKHISVYKSACIESSRIEKISFGQTT